MAATSTSCLAEGKPSANYRSERQEQALPKLVTARSSNADQAASNLPQIRGRSSPINPESFTSAISSNCAGSAFIIALRAPLVMPHHTVIDCIQPAGFLRTLLAKLNCTLPRVFAAIGITAMTVRGDCVRTGIIGVEKQIIGARASAVDVGDALGILQRGKHRIFARRARQQRRRQPERSQKCVGFGPPDTQSIPVGKCAMRVALEWTVGDQPGFPAGLGKRGIHPLDQIWIEVTVVFAV